MKSFSDYFNKNIERDVKRIERVDEKVSPEAKKEKDKIYKVYTAGRDDIIKLYDNLKKKEPNFKGDIENYFANYLYARYHQEVAELFSPKGIQPDADEHEIATMDKQYYENMSVDILKKYVDYRKEELKIIEQIIKKYNIKL